ncbi:hypothetical protein GCM10010981_04560 [Dyella nitratireducens]|uniref:Uncharacterized protein n=1 Tax=Dyella nitratireducens TaxID=1849580 RepID=A0ABQ1FL77_9GAMM|nr:hypothetical protein GCM10010981_04560 [Dyella nitratireducens]GLQ44482.1 hypothetical protein GCM10007902_43320 [Dyella nitratireducens]
MDSGLRRNDGEVLRNFPGQQWAKAGITMRSANGIDVNIKSEALSQALARRNIPG